ncbi:MAG: AAA family ATPase [Chthonomonadales bacterium]
MFETGLVIGKFYPPHAGHHFLISRAESEVRQLTVIVCGRVTDLIPAELRTEWLREIHPKVRVLVTSSDQLHNEDSIGWAARTKQILGDAPNSVFTSEPYGIPYTQALGCELVAVQRDDRKFPVSGTQARQDPFSVWKYLHPVVRGYFCLRVCMVGAESTGKTTLARGLAEHFNTNWVEEYGRRYTELKLEKARSMDEIKWGTEDFRVIARRQRAMEDRAARKADKLLFCDTDAFATAIWHERYMQTRDLPTEQIDDPSRIALYFLTDVDTPFHQDGLRDGEAIRHWMHDRFKQRLTAEGRRFVEISGGPEERLGLAIDHIQELLVQPFDFARANARAGYSSS